MKLEDVMPANKRFVAAIWCRQPHQKEFVWAGAQYGGTAQEAAQQASKLTEQWRISNSNTYTITIGEFTLAVEPPVPMPMRLIEI